MSPINNIFRKPSHVCHFFLKKQETIFSNPYIKVFHKTVLYISVSWGWCTGTTQRDGMGREEGGGFRMGNTCIPVVDSF